MALAKIMTDAELTTYYVCPEHKTLDQFCDYCILSEADFERASLAKKLLKKRLIFGHQTHIKQLRKLSELTMSVHEAKKALGIHTE